MNNIMTKTGSQLLSGGSLTLTFTIGTDNPSEGTNFELDQVLLHASGVISQVITVTHVGQEGSSTYAFVLDTTTTSSATDYVFRPTGKCSLKRGDAIKLTCANAGTPAITVYGKIQIRKID